jgi:hypothetical protein
MKKILLTSILGFFLYSCSSTKIENDMIKYFDHNDIEISKSKFKRKRSLRKFLEIPGESANHKKLTLREKRGKLAKREFLELLLEKEIGQEIDADKPIVIIYYPGKDECNSSIVATKESKTDWYRQLHEGVDQLAKTKPLYFYKNNEGIEKYHNDSTWHKDPEGIIEKLFFEHHYPCDSFVVISKTGEYISYFGEFGMKYVWEATQLMNN